MNYSIVDCFMTAFLCGLVFGLVYEVLRFVRRFFNMFLVTLICDISFFIVAGFFVFQLSLYLGNYVRIYTVLGFGAGVFAYIQTIGRLMGFAEGLILKLWGATIGALFRVIVKLFGKTFGAFAHMMGSIFGKINDFLKSHIKKPPLPLQFEEEKMYNNRKIKGYGENIGGKDVIQASIRRSP